VLRARLYNDINRLDPAIYENAYNVEVMNLIYPKLVGYVPNSDQWDWQLEAAEEIEEVDETHIRFRLRRGLMWSDGYGEITAEDVRYAYERVVDPEIDSPVKGDFGPLSHVEVEDRYTGVIVFSEPFPPVWTIALPYGVGHIVSRAAVEERGGGRFGMESTAFGGPFKLREWRTNEAVILERNEAWTGEEPAFDEVRLYPIPDQQAGEIAFEAGDIDYTQPSPASLERYRAQPPAGSRIETYPALFYVWVGMNLDHPKLQDIRVRQAIQWAIDVPMILEAAYFGEAPLATGIIAPGLIGHRPEASIPPEGDPARARALLEEAGEVGLEVNLAVRNTATFSTAAQIIQAQLNAVGFNCNINLHDSGVFWTLGAEAEGDQWQDLELILNRFSSSADPYYATQWFTRAQVGIWNWERFRSDHFDELHEMAVRETDRDKRDGMYQEMQQLMEESGAYRFITHEVNAVLHRDFILPAVRPDGVSIFNQFRRA
jgi:peptide/nickel transport system substrate-binding protein